MRARQPQVDLAIEAAGGPTALARIVGIKAPSIYSWNRIPADKVMMIERATGVPRHVLRPDVFPYEGNARTHHRKDVRS